MPNLQLSWDTVLPEAIRNLCDQRLRKLTRLPAAYSGGIPVKVNVVILVDTAEGMRCRINSIKVATSTLIAGMESGDPNKDDYVVGGAYNFVTDWRIKVLGFHFDRADGAVVLQEHKFSTDAAQVATNIESLALAGPAQLARPVSEALMAMCRLPAADPGAIPAGGEWHSAFDAARLAIIFLGGEDRRISALDTRENTLTELARLVHGSNIRLTLIAPETDSNLELCVLDRTEFYPVSPS